VLPGPGNPYHPIHRLGPNPHDRPTSLDDRMLGTKIAAHGVSFTASKWWASSLIGNWHVDRQSVDGRLDLIAAIQTKVEMCEMSAFMP
jgi:hypothetical protein